MGDEDEWKSLSTVGKIQHTQWKARAQGYTEASKLFTTQDSENSPVFNEYVNLIKKFVLDPNAIAQESGLDATLAFLENASVATKCAGDVVAALVSKGLPAARAKSKDKAIECMLQIVEIERHEVVCEELLKGLSNKNPKLVVGCLQTLREILNLFGPKVIQMKPVIKEFPHLLDARDKSVRAEAKNLIVEVCRWLGPGSLSLLTELKPVVVAEITATLESLPSAKPTPQRFLKSQRPKMDTTSCDPSSNAEVTGGGSEDCSVAGNQVDLNDLIAPAEVLSKIPNEYWTLITEKKWQDRQQALESIDKLTDVPRIEQGDFGELIRSLLHVINKDTNVVIITLATKVLGQLANGLGKKFSSYAQPTVAACLGKFKERKGNLITTLRVTVDAAAKSIALDAMLEDIVAALHHKTPGVRAETASFLARLFDRCTPTVLTKKVLKTLITPLCETSKDNAGDVRESSFAALGAAMRVAGAKNVEPFLGDLDALRMSKIKEYCEQTSTNGGKSENEPAEARPGTAPTTAASKPRRGAPPPQRPATAAGATKETPSESGSGPVSGTDGPPSKASTAKGSKGKPTVAKVPAAASKSAVITEVVLSDDQVMQKACDLFDENLINQLSVAEWKERLAGMTALQERSESIGFANLPTQVMCRIVLRKPGLKDTNVQVLRARLEYIQAVVNASDSVSSNLTELLLPELLDKVGDVKVGDAVKMVLTVLSERCSFTLVGEQLLKTVFQVKNPRSQTEALSWLTQAIREFGMKLPPQDVIATLRTGLNATNPSVRQTSLSLAAVVHLFMGDPMRNLLADEKPAVLTLLNAEFDKNVGQKPPAPTRGPAAKVAASQAVVSVEDQDGDAVTETIAEEGEKLDLEALLPRVDIRPKLTADLLTLLSSKLWKERQEGLTQIQGILSSAKYIEGSNGGLQDTLSAVAKVCGDSNKNLSKLALNVLRDFALALPKSDAAKYVKFVEPSILLTFGDSKPHVREAANAALTAWQSRVPFVVLVENDMLSDALKVENAFLRSDLLRWLTEALTPLPPNYRKQLPSELTANLMPWVFAAMEDRNPDARKYAQLTLPQLIRVLGWEGVSKAAGRLKATSKDTIMPHLEKAKEAVATKCEKVATGSTDVVNDKPVAPKKAIANQKTESSTASSPLEDAEESTSSAVSVRGGKKKPDTKKTAATSGAASKKSNSDESSTAGTPLQPHKAARTARITDEKKRKLLKWDFDAPTRDHVQQLNQLFIAAGASSELHTMLFHSDFKQHLKALDVLSQLLDSGPDGEQATFVNMDIILRWVVLRFFETNPVVLGRCIDYVIKLFSHLSEAAMSLTEHEASAFLPYLVLKSGDSKDAIRDGIRDIFKLTVNLYPPSRLFMFLSNGIKSKINKTRLECLKEMGSLIERFGVTVCQPSVPVALKAISQQIGDRDGEVRSAALNALAFAHAVLGEQMWKIIGPLPDKDRTMLEERIKRAGLQSAITISITDVPESRPSRQTISHGRREPPESQRSIDDPRMFARPLAPVSAAQQRAQAMLNELGDLSPEKAPKMPDLIALDADISDLFKPIDIPTLKTQSRQPVLNALLRTSPDTASAITMVVTAISSSDLLVSCHALAEVDVVLRDEKWYLLLNHVNQILMLITMQLRQVTTRYFGDPSIADEQLRTLIRCHLATLDSLFQRPTLGRETSRETLRELIQSLLHLMLDERTTAMPDGENVIRAINTLCVHIIESANQTRILSALIRLLHESVSNGQFTSRFVQALMKSLWRITKNMDSTVSNYSFDVILLDCHHFLKAFPSVSWKTRKSDVPIRTIKTMLHVMCKLQGPSILEFLDNIPNKEDSELEAYLNRTLQTIGAAPHPTVSKSRNTSGSEARTKLGLPSAVTREKLTEIFKKVGSKSQEQVTQGLNELYDFTQVYPEMDLGVFLSKTSPFFQTYIKQALKNIAVERARQAKGLNTYADGDVDRSRTSFRGTINGSGTESAVPSIEPLPTELQSVDPKVFMNRLAHLRRELGLGGISTTNVDGDTVMFDANHDDGKVRNAVLENTLRNMVSPGDTGSDQPKQVTGSATNDQPEPRPSIAPHELLDIRRRLDRIKSGQPV